MREKEEGIRGGEERKERRAAGGRSVIKRGFEAEKRSRDGMGLRTLAGIVKAEMLIVEQVLALQGEGRGRKREKELSDHERERENERKIESQTHAATLAAEYEVRAKVHRLTIGPAATS